MGQLTSKIMGVLQAVQQLQVVTAVSKVTATNTFDPGGDELSEHSNRDQIKNPMHSTLKSMPPKIQLNPITMSFKGECRYLEKAFINEYNTKSLNHIRISLFLGLILYAVFGLLDGALVPDQKTQLWFIRYAVVCPCIFISILLSLKPGFKKYMQVCLVFLMVITGGGISIMVAIASPPANYSYYAGVILVLMMSYGFIKARFIWASAAGWINVIFYEIVAVWIVQTPGDVLLNNNFFFISANIIGMFICYSNELYARKNYYMTLQLEFTQKKTMTLNRELEERVRERTADINQTNESLQKEIEAHKREKEERKLAEKELMESEALFKLITRHTSALFSIHDSNANYVFASSSHERLGYKPEDLIGQSSFTMMAKEDIGLMLEYLDKARHQKLSHALLNYRLIDKKGEIHNFRGSFDTVFKPDGSIERIICVGEDETELLQAQVEKTKAFAAAAEAKKLALIGQVAGKMAHDFNNILGIIMGISELSLLDCRDEKISKDLELIFNQTIRGRNLTRNLVAFAKSQEPKQEFFKISEKIDLVLDLLKKDLENIELMVDHEPNIPEVLADPGMIEHALVNLLQNSIHATSKTKHPRINIRTYHFDKNICFEIEDNGCGIPKEHLENIYDPSFTLKGSRDVKGEYKSDIKGTGYGMSNIKKYIEQHNGKIRVESVVNSQTKFIISLPVVKKELTRAEKIEIQKETAHVGKYILLVEDETAIADVQYRVLTQDPCNHKVDTANNGQVAINLFDKNEYDFVSLDYILPGNINGMDVYHHIRKTNKAIPILFISGNIEFLESIKELKQKDVRIDHLSKPCKNTDYVSAINTLFERIGTSFISSKV